MHASVSGQQSQNRRETSAIEALLDWSRDLSQKQRAFVKISHSHMERPAGLPLCLRPSKAACICDKLHPA